MNRYIEVRKDNGLKTFIYVKDIIRVEQVPKGCYIYLIQNQNTLRVFCNEDYNDVILMMQGKERVSKSIQIKHPSYYNLGKEQGIIETNDITSRIGFEKGNVVKYLARAGKKENVPEKVDLSKAKEYLKFYNENRKNKEPLNTEDLERYFEFYKYGNIIKQVLFSKDTDDITPIIEMVEKEINKF